MVHAEQKGKRDCHTNLIFLIIYAIIPLYRRMFCDGHVILVFLLILHLLQRCRQHSVQINIQMNILRIWGFPIPCTSKTHTYVKNWKSKIFSITKVSHCIAGRDPELELEPGAGAGALNFPMLQGSFCFIIFF